MLTYFIAGCKINSRNCSHLTNSRVRHDLVASCRKFLRYTVAAPLNGITMGQCFVKIGLIIQKFKLWDQHTHTNKFPC